MNNALIETTALTTIFNKMFITGPWPCNHMTLESRNLIGQYIYNVFKFLNQSDLVLSETHQYVTGSSVKVQWPII